MFTIIKAFEEEDKNTSEFLSDLFTEIIGVYNLIHQEVSKTKKENQPQNEQGHRINTFSDKEVL